MSDFGSQVPPEPSSYSLTQETSSDGQAGQGQDEGLANGFLKNVDPRDRPVVEKYLRDWDRGVNARFREIHSQYEPYKRLGVSAEDMEQAVRVAQLLNSDPEYVWNTLGQTYGYGGQGASAARQGTGSPINNSAVGNGGTPVGTTPQQYEGLPEAFVSEFGQMRDLLTAVAQEMLTNRKSAEQAKQDQELDTELNNLKNKYGDFDTDFVIAKMFQGKSGDQAVQEYKAFVQNVLNSHASSSRPVPPILGGGGAVPAGINASELTRKDTKTLMAQMLAAGANQNQ